MHQALTLFRPLQGLKARSTQLGLHARGLWRAYPRETVGFGLFGLVTAAAIAGAAYSAPEAAAQTVPPPAPPPLLLKQVAPEQALRLNAAIPVAQGPNPAA